MASRIVAVNGQVIVIDPPKGSIDGHTVELQVILPGGAAVTIAPRQFLSESTDAASDPQLAQYTKTTADSTELTADITTAGIYEFFLGGRSLQLTISGVGGAPVLVWTSQKVARTAIAGAGGGGGGGGAATIADGADVTQGALADAAVVGDVNGSLSAKLRGLSKILNDVWVSASHWLKVQAQAGENHLGEVGGNSRDFHVNLTVALTAYVAGNNVGGKLTVANFVRIAAQSDVLQHLVIIDKSNVKAPLDIVFFNADPAATTFTDHAAMPTIAAADVSKIIHRVSISAGDYVTVGGIAIAEPSFPSKIMQMVGTDVWFAISTSGTPTFLGANDVTVGLGVLRD